MAKFKSLKKSLLQQQHLSFTVITVQQQKQKEIHTIRIAVVGELDPNEE